MKGESLLSVFARTECDDLARERLTRAMDAAIPSDVHFGYFDFRVVPGDRTATVCTIIQTDEPEVVSFDELAAVLGMSRRPSA